MRQYRPSPLPDDARECVFGDERLGQCQHRLVDRHVHDLAAAGLFAVAQRHERAKRAMQSGELVTDRDADAAWRPVRLAADVAQPAHRLADRSVARA
jgi:hypothetical protein